MNAKELFDAGELSAAIEQLNQEVKAAPTDAHKRTFLFELLCFSGDLQRAERQLDALLQVSGNALLEIGVQVYRNILEAEKARRRVFKEGARPKFLLTAPSYANLYLEALRQLRNDQASEFGALLSESDYSRLQIRGTIDAVAFQSFRDADDRLAPFLEVIAQREYVWLPFEQIKRVEIDAPKRLRDLLWTPARIELQQQPLGEVFLPVLYPGSYEEQDGAIKLGRMTDWKSVGESLFVGVGQKMFLVDGAERALLEIRDIQFD